MNVEDYRVIVSIIQKRDYQEFDKKINSIELNSQEDVYSLFDYKGQQVSLIEIAVCWISFDLNINKIIDSLLILNSLLEFDINEKSLLSKNHPMWEKIEKESLSIFLKKIPMEISSQKNYIGRSNNKYCNKLIQNITPKLMKKLNFKNHSKSIIHSFSVDYNIEMFRIFLAYSLEFSLFYKREKTSIEFKKKNLDFYIESIENKMKIILEKIENNPYNTKVYVNCIKKLDYQKHYRVFSSSCEMRLLNSHVYKYGETTHRDCLKNLKIMLEDLEVNKRYCRVRNFDFKKDCSVRNYKSLFDDLIFISKKNYKQYLDSFFKEKFTVKNDLNKVNPKLMLFICDYFIVTEEAKENQKQNQKNEIMKDIIERVFLAFEKENLNINFSLGFVKEPLICLATEKGNSYLMSKLIEAGADPTYKNRDNKNLLIKAVSSGVENKKIYKILFEQEISETEVDNTGKNAFDYVVFFPNIKSILDEYISKRDRKLIENNVGKNTVKRNIPL